MTIPLHDWHYTTNFVPDEVIKMLIQHDRCPRCGVMIILKKGDIHICPEEPQVKSVLPSSTDSSGGNMRIKLRRNKRFKLGTKLKLFKLVAARLRRLREERKRR